MGRDRIVLAAALAAAALLAGCGPPWKVVKKSGPPSALKGMQQMGVRFDYSGISLGGESEQAFLERQPAEDKQSYQEVKQKLDSSFVSGIQSQLPGVNVVPAREGTPGAPITLTVQWSFLVMGKYAVFYAQDTEIEAHLVFQKPDGTVVDHIIVRTTVGASVTQPSILQRVGIGSQRLAELGALYVKKAQKPSQ